MNAEMKMTGRFGRRIVIPLVTLLSFANAAMATGTTRSSTNQVQISNYSFSPKTLTVSAGTSVTWINGDDTPHTVTSDATPRVFNSPPLDTDDKFSFTFTAPGTYKYFCTLHPHMVGVVVVK